MCYSLLTPSLSPSTEPGRVSESESGSRDVMVGSADKAAMYSCDIGIPDCDTNYRSV